MSLVDDLLWIMQLLKVTVSKSQQRRKKSSAFKPVTFSVSYSLCVHRQATYPLWYAHLYKKRIWQSHRYRVLPSMGICKDNANTNLGRSLAYGRKLIDSV